MRFNPRSLKSERGVSIAELLIGMFTFLVVFTAILTMVQAAMHNQDRVAKRVYANQRARPVLTKLIDNLHSACVAPGIAPILEGSDGSSIRFLSLFGSSVSPTPDKRIVALSGSTLTEYLYRSTGGAPPDWDYPDPANPDATRQLLTGVGPGLVGDPPVSVPLFRYYAYVGGVVSPTPLAVPLTEANAAKTVQVDIAFSSSPGSTVTPEVSDRITLTDSTTLRLEPASEDSAEVNLPCV